jgi:PKD repeat protein
MKSVLIILLSTLFLVLQANALSAEIEASPSSGKAPLTVQFSVSTEDTITSYSWDFDGDGTEDSTDSNPSYTYNKAGTYTAKLTASDGVDTVTTSKTIVVSSPVSVTVSATPTSGEAPLTVQFTASASGGQEPYSYAWDFNNDGATDDTTQNPRITLRTPLSYNVRLTVTDTNGNSASKMITVNVGLHVSRISLVSYFPKTIDLGDQAITFIIKNEGTEVLTELDAKLIGNGIQHLSSTKISRLNPGDQDSITVQAKFLQPGSVQAIAKISDNSFSVNFSVGSLLQLSHADLQKQLEEIKKVAQDYESQYFQKKSEGYLVEAAQESIKVAREYIKSAEESLITGKLQSTKSNLELATSNLNDAKRILETALKEKKNIAQLLRENALAITAVIAALAGVSGIILRAIRHARRFGERFTKAVSEHKHHHKEAPAKKSSKKPKKKREKPLVSGPETRGEES